jgi:transcription elongation factor Elf1
VQLRHTATRSSRRTGERRKEKGRTQVCREEKLLPSPFSCPFVSVKVLIVPRHFSSQDLSRRRAVADAAASHCDPVFEKDRRKEKGRTQVCREEKLLPSPFFCPFVSVKVLIVPNH